jgi:predicted ATPase
VTTLLAAQGGIEDGAWLVELASLSDPDPVPQAVASVLGVRGLPGDTLLDSLCLHAQELYISLRPVNAHMGSVYNKTGCSTRAGAARFASEHGLL